MSATATLNTSPSPAIEAGIGLQESYARVGDIDVHYVEAGAYNLSSRLDGFTEYTADKPAEDIRGLSNELGAESAMLVGHDWGGTVAWTLAMNPPEVVDRLAILNAAHPRKLNERTAQPASALAVLVLLLLPVPVAARAPCAPVELALLQ